MKNQKKLLVLLLTTVAACSGGGKSKKNSPLTDKSVIKPYDASVCTGLSSNPVALTATDWQLSDEISMQQPGYMVYVRFDNNTSTASLSMSCPNNKQVSVSVGFKTEGNNMNFLEEKQASDPDDEVCFIDTSTEVVQFGISPDNKLHICDPSAGNYHFVPKT